MAKKIVNRFAEHLAVKERRESRKITQRDIEAETGIAKTTVGRYLRNESKFYETRVVAIICKYLGIDPSDFFAWVDDDSFGDDDSKELSAPLLASA